MKFYVTDRIDISISCLGFSKVEVVPTIPIFVSVSRSILEQHKSQVV